MIYAKTTFLNFYLENYLSNKKISNKEKMHLDAKSKHIFLERSSLPRAEKLSAGGYSEKSETEVITRKPVVRLVYSHPSRLRKKAQTREET